MEIQLCRILWCNFWTKTWPTSTSRIPCIVVASHHYSLAFHMWAAESVLPNSIIPEIVMYFLNQKLVYSDFLTCMWRCCCTSSFACILNVDDKVSKFSCAANCDVTTEPKINLLRLHEAHAALLLHPIIRLHSICKCFQVSKFYVAAAPLMS